MRFDILSRHCKIDRHYMLEASAGTGKTYSIEHIVVRLLIESKILIEQILVVTFTRAATRDLKMRIRNNLEYARAVLNLEIGNAPDYLMALIEEGQTAIQKAQKLLERALFCLDQLQVFTIHGFCSRMLRDFAFEANIGEQIEEGAEQRLQALTDFLRTGVTAEKWSPAQLQLLLKRVRDWEEWRRSLIKVRGANSLPHFHICVNQFRGIMSSLHYEGKKIVEDFEALAPRYNKVKEETKERVARFAALFDKSEWTAADLDELIANDFCLIHILDPTNLNKKKLATPLPSLHYPDLYSQLSEAFAPLIPCSDPKALLQKLALEAQGHLKRFLVEEEMFDFDGLLEAMQRAIANRAFVTEVRKRYPVAIIDEFQDTDPIQWQIFRKLFLDEPGHHLYLVGDPKQSIYAFRQADIYTYLEAAKALGEEYHAVLDTNFRSDPALVEALNCLFTTAKEWMPLPRLQKTLPYRPVQAGKRAEAAFQDSRGSIHFYLGESEEQFFLSLYSEIVRLNVPLEAWAFLVSDRYQGARLKAFLQERGIPIVMQRQEPLASSKALSALRELVEAALKQDESSLKIALGGPFINWTEEQLLDISEVARGKIAAFGQLLHDFPRFFATFLKSSFHSDGKSIVEHLLASKEGVELYDDLNQIVEWVLRRPSEPILKSLKQLEQEDGDQGIKRLANYDLKGVQILTLHSSKGLEFDIVCPIGLIRETKASSDPLEGDAEKMRQLYVALTRAKRRLYIPVVPGKAHAPGTAPPISLFLQHVQLEELVKMASITLERVENIEEPEKAHQEEFVSLTRCSSFLSENFFDMLTHGARGIGEDNSQRAIFEPMPLAAVSAGQESRSLKTGTSSLSFPTFALPKQIPASISSYTSLHHPKQDYSILQRVKENGLPAGSRVGNVLHTLLEKVPFELIREMKRSEELLSWMDLEEEWRPWQGELANMVYNAFHTPLPLASGPTPLALIDPCKQYRETEFLFPWEESFAIPEVSHVPGFLKGVIDLLFEHEGRYYLLDWKSNRLENYKRESMERAMHEGGYFLQAEVYREALRRYLQIVDPGPFEERFGAIFYLFLRGLGTYEIK